jgi:PAS domain S-box-containing protein
LYVDDEPDLLAICREFLEQSGALLVDTALSASDARERLVSRRYDAIISDYQMPGMNGIEFLKYVRQNHGDIPFILFTGRGREEIVIEALNFGADFYLQKGGMPVPQFTELEHKIRQAVQQRQANRQVAESEERYRTLFENADDAIFLMDRDIFIDCNKKALELFISNYENLIGSRVWDHSPASQPDGTRSETKCRTLVDLALEGESRVFEWRHRRGDGTEFDVETSLTRLHVKDRDLLLAIVRDVSMRRRTECALRESAQLMTDIISFLPDATFVINNEGVVIAWNRSMEKMTGVPESAIIGKGDHEYALPFYGERRPILIDLILSYDEHAATNYSVIAENGSKLISEQYIAGLNGGSGSHLWFTASPLVDSRGNVIGAIESIRDITAHKNRESELQAAYEQVSAMEEELRNNFEELAGRERALSENEAKFRSLFTTMVEGNALCEILFDDTGKATDYRILEVNPAFERILGISPETAIGKTSRQVFTTDEPSALALYSRVAATGKPETVEFWYPPLKKHLSISVYSPMNGRFATVFEDITKRKVNEKELRAAYEQITAVEEELRNNFEELAARELALRASEEKYSRIVETANDGILAIDTEMKITFLNTRLAGMLGYKVPEVTGRPVTEFIIEDEIAGNVTQVNLRLLGGRGTYERGIRHRDGRIIWCQVSASPVVDSHGVFQGSFAMITDITARKAQEQDLRAAYEQITAVEEELRNNFDVLSGQELALRTSEERYRTIVETANEGIWEMDNDYVTTSVNQRLADMLGYTAGELIGHRITEYLLDEDIREHEQMVLNRMEGKSDTFERRFRNKNGSFVWCLVSATPVKDAQGNFLGSFAMFTDITSRKNAENELHDKFGELDAATEDMSMALEELKSTEQMLVERNRDLEEEQASLADSEKSLRLVNRKLNLMAGITRHDVLNQLMILNGFIELSARNPEEGKILSLIEKERLVIERIHHQISFTKEYQEIGIQAPLWQDVSEVARKAVTGLDLSNVALEIRTGALEIYADPLLLKVFYNLVDNALRYGGKVTRVTISGRMSESGAVISVEDDGVGIEPEIKAYIFEKGFGKNTGFGLFLASEILEITGLSITENGTPGNGAKFDILIPDGLFRLRE